MYISLFVLSIARVQFPVMAGYFKEFFLADHTVATGSEPAWQKMAQSPLNGITQPVDIEEEGLRPTTDRQWLGNKFHIAAIN